MGFTNFGDESAILCSLWNKSYSVTFVKPSSSSQANEPLAHNFASIKFYTVIIFSYWVSRDSRRPVLLCTMYQHCVYLRSVQSNVILTHFVLDSKSLSWVKLVSGIFIVAPCISFQFTKKNQQMHLKSILKTHTKTLKIPYMFRSTTIFREHTWYLADY
jgi:hypothetical protein